MPAVGEAHPVDAFLRAEADDDVKVVIISGAGRAFSAGADLASFGGPADTLPRAAADAGRRMAEAIEGMEAATIAAVHGHCVGGGVVLAGACDLRIAAESTRFSIPEVDLGIPLAWTPVTPTLMGTLVDQTANATAALERHLLLA